MEVKRKFIVAIQETVGEGFEIFARNAEEAFEIAAEKYRNCKIVLEPGEVIYKKMAVVKPEKDETPWEEF